MASDNVKVTFNGPPDFSVGGLGRLIPGKSYEVAPEVAEQLLAGRWFTEGGEPQNHGSPEKPKPKSEPKKEAGS